MPVLNQTSHKVETGGGLNLNFSKHKRFSLKGLGPREAQVAQFQRPGIPPPSSCFFHSANARGLGCREGPGDRSSFSSSRSVSGKPVATARLAVGAAGPERETRVYVSI